MVPDGSLKIHINRNRNGYSYNIIYMNIHGSFFLMAKILILKYSYMDIR